MSAAIPTGRVVIVAGRRLRRLAIGNCFLPTILGPGEHHYRISRDALPADGRVVDVRLCANHFEVTIQSESFEPVAEGGLIPEMDILFTSLPDARPTH